jgi:carboxyl-terminal processing protease
VVVRVNSLADEEVARRFDRAFPDFTRVTGLILDLRAAAGGRSEFAYRILARLTDKPLLGARWKTPEYRAAFRAWGMADSTTTWYGPPPDTVGPRTDLPPYTGPIAVLASSGTAGAAEDLLVAFQNSGRGMIVGEPSAASPGDVAAFQLPKNWAVQFSVTRHTFPGGAEFAVTGIKPEIAVTQPISDFLAGRDAVMEKAREYLKTVEAGRRR